MSFTRFAYAADDKVPSSAVERSSKFRLLATSSSFSEVETLAFCFKVGFPLCGPDVSKAFELLNMDFMKRLDLRKYIDHLILFNGYFQHGTRYPGKCDNFLEGILTHKKKR